MNDQDREIIKTLSYFNHFSYTPTLDQLHMFYSYRIKRSDLESFIMRLISSGKIIEVSYEGQKVYTPGGIAPRIRMKKQRRSNTVKKLKKVRLYISLLTKVAFVHFIGISGSLAM
ncbi:MAG: hypothetical protein ACMG6E_07595, partial [Candidatus Roizmanbacteria bacterium]